MAETAVSRVLNSSPIMVIPPLILVRLQRSDWLRKNPRFTMPVNLGLILVTSYAVLPLALAAFPQRQKVKAESLEEEFHGRGGNDGLVVFNRGFREPNQRLCARNDTRGIGRRGSWVEGRLAQVDSSHIFISGFARANVGVSPRATCLQTFRWP